MTFSPPNAISSYLPVEFDIPMSPDAQRIFINQRERLTATILNVKENANYELFELLTAQQYFSTQPAGTINTPRYTFRKVIDFGALPNNATKSVAHGLVLDDGVNPSTWFFTKIQADAFDPAVGAELGISIPYYDIVAGAVANPINIFVNQTNVVITTTSNRTNFTRCYVTLEYIKNF